ncbi:MxaS protein [Trinickia caryophylli]|uniref:DUF58 domain-containing protein n=1 Tax=Trinickia caryophylli TaxID=28094 RepID=A0A1X7E1X5_TRICW|nr:MxaS protein [Trinickia caryophylli]PMS14050.1 MxaS protein [Trinickia caryophylli]TRX17746.1 MxaS protein [Trinickia caryophylli]WQE11492.1 MxaS protein [Trinickia caryophylli]SMF25643.1 hypothetical protein SAMN06295900_104350 [Trinickia caryophylli]GLU32656.1 hypothetical protein Busp01_24980 [Trinickia caryophylli]
MNGPREIHYRLPGRASGFRPGSHPGTSFGAGQMFAMHARLVDYPDPRRLDLRASVASPRREWLVRLQQQRVAVPVQVVVDVSPSMYFGTACTGTAGAGTARSKLDVVADFVEALGYSAFRSGDRVGMSAFDTDEREDLFMPPRVGRGGGDLMAAMLRGARVDAPVRARRHARDGAHGAHGLARALAKLAGRGGLVFIASDFHWPLDTLPSVLDALSHACVVPIVVWDRAELEPPRAGSLLAVHDLESGARRTLWLSERVRANWRAAVAKRRMALDTLFGRRGMRPFYVEGEFDADALSRYFLEQTA